MYPSTRILTSTAKVGSNDEMGGWPQAIFSGRQPAERCAAPALRDVGDGVQAGKQLSLLEADPDEKGPGDATTRLTAADGCGGTKQPVRVVFSRRG